MAVVESIRDWPGTAFRRERRQEPAARRPFSAEIVILPCVRREPLATASDETPVRQGE